VKQDPPPLPPLSKSNPEIRKYLGKSVILRSISKISVFSSIWKYLVCGQSIVVRKTSKIAMQKRNSHHKNLKIFPAGLLRLAVFLHDGFHFPEPQGIVTINFKGGSSYGANHFQVLKPFRVSKKYFLKCSVISVITRKQISRITFVQLSQRILYSWTCKTILLCYSE